MTTISTGCTRPPDHQQRHQQERHPGRDPACRRRRGDGRGDGRSDGRGDRLDSAAHASSTASASAAGADDRLDDSLLAQLLVGNLVGHPAPRDDQHTIAETGELERIARLDDHRHAVSRLVPESLIDVESRGDVDALGRLVGEDHPDLATQKCSAQCDLLLVAARKEPNGLLDRRSPHFQASG